MLFNMQQTRIGKLSAHGAVREEPVFKLGLTSLLDNTDLKPPGMPPNAILIIKHMSDPLPGKISSHKQRLIPADDWAQAAREQLQHYYHQAVRPQNGMISLDCDAIVFADISELLACLVRDLASGSAWQKWWWTILLSRVPRDLSFSRRITTL